MNPKIVFSFIIGLGLGLLLGYIFTDLNIRKQEKNQFANQAQGMPAQPGENPHQMDGVMERIQNLEGMLVKDPDNYNALVELGNLYYDARMFDQAAPRYERAVEINDKDPNILTDLGTCYRNTGDFKKAVEVYEKASKVDPSHWHSIYNACVVALYDLKDKEAARGYYQKLIKVVPAEVNLSEIKVELGIS